MTCVIFTGTQRISPEDQYFFICKIIKTCGLINLKILMSFF